MSHIEGWRCWPLQALALLSSAVFTERLTPCTIHPRHATPPAQYTSGTLHPRHATLPAQYTPGTQTRLALYLPMTTATPALPSCLLSPSSSVILRMKLLSSLSLSPRLDCVTQCLTSLSVRRSVNQAWWVASLPYCTSSYTPGMEYHTPLLYVVLYSRYGVPVPVCILAHRIPSSCTRVGTTVVILPPVPR